MEGPFTGDGISVKRYTEQLAAKIDSLPIEDRKKLFDRIRSIVPKPYLSKYCPPTISPKQEAFLCAPNLEVLFGGAAGGSKTASLLIAALQYADQPNYNALIVRRTYAELAMPGATMSLANEWLSKTDARKMKGQDYVFPAGATLTFGYLCRPDDKYRYGSANYDYIGVDEAAEFPIVDDYTFLFSRIRRRKGSKIPPRMRLAANPVGPGATWLKKRFITFPGADNLKSEPCFLCNHFHWDKQCTNECDCEKNPNSEPRLYVPAKLDDNPYIDVEAYLRSLSQLDPFMRQALRNGDWDAKPPGKMFQRKWFKVIPEQAMPRSLYCYRVRFWDLAATQEDKGKNPSWTCGVRMSYDDYKFTVEDVIRLRETPGEVKRVVMNTAESDGADVEVWIEKEGGSSGKAVIDDYIRSMPRFAVRPFDLSGRSKEVRAMPFAAQAEGENVRLLAGAWNETFLEELEQFPSSAWKNDQVDASAGAYNVLSENGQWVAPESYGERQRPDWNFNT